MLPDEIASGGYTAWQRVDMSELRAAPTHGDPAPHKCTDVLCGYPRHSSQLTGLKVCARCKTVAYCSRECQRVQWPHHKHACKKLCAGTIEYTRSVVVDGLVLLITDLCSDDLSDAQDLESTVDVRCQGESMAGSLVVDNTPVAAFVYSMLGEFYLFHKLWDEAIRTFARAIALYEYMGDQFATVKDTVGSGGRGPQTIAYRYRSLATCYRHQKMMPEATTSLQKCIDIYEGIRVQISNVLAVDVSDEMARIYLELAQYYDHTCRNRLACTAVNQGLVLAREYGDEKLVRQALTLCASLYRQRGNFRVAMLNLEQALRSALDAGLPTHEINAYQIKIAACYQYFGDYDDAIMALDKCVRRGMSSADTGDHAQYYISYRFGQCTAALGHYSRAARFFYKCQQYAEIESFDVQTVSELHMQLGATVLKEGIRAMFMDSSEDAIRRCSDGASMLCSSLLTTNSCSGFLDAHMCLAHYNRQMNLHDAADYHIWMHMHAFSKHSRSYCSGCLQPRHCNVKMVTCSGCRVARFCDAHCQLRASSRYLPIGRVRHSKICGLITKMRDGAEDWLRTTEEPSVEALAGMTPALRQDLKKFIQQEAIAFTKMVDI